METSPTHTNYWRAAFLILNSSFLILNYAASQTALLLPDRDTIRIGEQAILNLEITFNPKDVGDEIYWPEFADTLSSQIELLKEGAIDTLKQDFAAETQITLHQPLTITAWEAGRIAIPPIRFLVKMDTVTTNTTFITVVSPDVNPDEDFKDIKDIYDVKDNILAIAKKYWYWIVAALAVIGAILYFLFRKKKAVVQLVISEEEKLSAHERALKQLHELYAKELWQKGHLKEYHTELTDILRSFIESRFAIHAREEISSQIIRDLRKVIADAEMLNDVQRVLMIADMAKFAKQQPMAYENETAFVVVKHFVERHIPKQEKVNA